MRIREGRTRKSIRHNPPLKVCARKRLPLDVRDRSPTRTPEVPQAAIDPMRARLEANSRYALVEVLIMVMAYHYVDRPMTPRQLANKCLKHIGYKTNETAVYNTLLKYKFSPICDPEMPFKRQKSGWTLNTDAKIGFDDPEWEDFIFARGSAEDSESSQESESQLSESAESSSHTEDEVAVSNVLLDLGSRPDDLSARLEYLEKEVQRLASIERKYMLMMQE